MIPKQICRNHNVSYNLLDILKLSLNWMFYLRNPKHPVTFENNPSPVPYLFPFQHSFHLCWYCPLILRYIVIFKYLQTKSSFSMHSKPKCRIGWARTMLRKAKQSDCIHQISLMYVCGSKSSKQSIGSIYSALSIH